MFRLFCKCSKPTSEEDKREFFRALEANEVDKVEFFLKFKLVSPNIESERGTPALFYTVCDKPKVEMAEVLLKYGANPNCRNFVRRLVDHGYYYYGHGDYVDESGRERNPKHYEAYQRFFALIEVVRRYGARAYWWDLFAMESSLSYVNKDYIYNKNSFERKVIDYFRNDSYFYKPRKVDLDDTDYDLYIRNRRPTLG